MGTVRQLRILILMDSVEMSRQCEFDSYFICAGGAEKIEHRRISQLNKTTHENGEPVASVLYYFLMSLAHVVSPSPPLAKIKHSSLTRWRMEMQKARELL